MASPTTKCMQAMPPSVQHALAEPQLTALALATRDVDLIADSLGERQLHRLRQLLEADPDLASTGAQPDAVKALLRHLRAESHQSKARRRQYPAYAAQFDNHRALFEVGQVQEPLVPKRGYRALDLRPAGAGPAAVPRTIDEWRRLAAMDEPLWRLHRVGDNRSDAVSERHNMKALARRIRHARTQVEAYEREVAREAARVRELAGLPDLPPSPADRHRRAREGIARRATMGWEQRVLEDVQVIARLGRRLPRASDHARGSMMLWERPDPWARLRS